MRALIAFLLLLSLHAHGNESHADTKKTPAKLTRFQIPSITLQQLGGSGVGNGGLWLATQLQQACEQRLVPLLKDKNNSKLMDDEDRAVLIDLITSHRIPFEMVDPKTLEPGRYFDPQGREALTINGRLRDNTGTHGRDVDSRIVLDGKRSFKLVVQMDENLWSQYTGGGHYFPDYVLTQIFHEILRYAWYTEKTDIADEDYVLSSLLKFPKENSLETADGFMKPFHFGIDAIFISGESYRGTIPCYLANFVEPSNEETKQIVDIQRDLRSCEVRLSFEHRGVKDLGFSSSEQILQALGRPVGTGKVKVTVTPSSGGEVPIPKSLSYIQSGDQIQLHTSEGVQHKLKLSRGSEMLVLPSGIRMLYREQETPTDIIGKDFTRELFCDDVDFALTSSSPLASVDYPSIHMSKERCWISVHFKSANEVVLSKFQNNKWESRVASYTRVGNNILVEKKSYALKLPGEGIYFNVVDMGFTLDLITNSGESLFVRGSSREQSPSSIVGERFQGFARCGQVRRPFTGDQGVCRVYLEFTRKKLGDSNMVRMGSKRVKPFESAPTWSVGTYEQAGTQVQMNMLGAGRSLSYRIRGSLLVNPFGSSMQKALPHEKAPF